MSLTNKLFSLLGFPEPMTLKRFNGKNLLPENLLVLSINNHLNTGIQYSLTQLPTKIIENVSNATSKSIEALVIDATHYIDENSYHNLYIKVQKTLRLLTNNARILIISNSISTNKSVEENTFNQALIGFSKSLAKEIGRKGSTVNIIQIDTEKDIKSNTTTALINPIKFFVSAKSAFVSGQVLTVNSKAKSVDTLINGDTRQRVAVVTGAAQGIGAAIATKLTDEGYLVIGIDIEPMKTQLMSTMKDLQGDSFILDVSAKTAGKQLSTLAKKYNGFDLMVHNAGITRDKTLAKMPEHFWQQTLDINLLSVIRINKVLINNSNINKGGSIVCLSSMNGIAGQGGQTNYACSKAGVVGYVNSINKELSVMGITINAVAPGFIETQMTQNIPFIIREMGRKMSALGQGGLPSDVAETVSFLGDQSSSSVSGQTIRVCGLNLIGA